MFVLLIASFALVAFIAVYLVYLVCLVCFVYLVYLVILLVWCGGILLDLRLFWQFCLLENRFLQTSHRLHNSDPGHFLCGLWGSA